MHLYHKESIKKTTTLTTASTTGVSGDAVITKYSNRNSTLLSCNNQFNNIMMYSQVVITESTELQSLTKHNRVCYNIDTICKKCRSMHSKLSLHS